MKKLLGLLAVCLLAVHANAAPNPPAGNTKPEIEFKVLLIIKQYSDAYSPLFLPIRSSMTEAEIETARHCFEVETPDMVREITGGKVRFVPTVYVSDAPLRVWDPTRLDSAEFDVNELLSEYYSIAKPGDYDSVGYYFINSDHDSGYAAPRAGYGVGWYQAEQRVGVFAINSTVMNPRDEIFLHEWMHGLDGFYGDKPGVKLPKGLLHGIPNYPIYKSRIFRPGDTFKGWMDWYRDYLNANIKDGNELRGLGDSAWKYGPIRNAALADPPKQFPPLPSPPTYPSWAYGLVKGDLTYAKLGPNLLTAPLSVKDQTPGAWQLEKWSATAGSSLKMLDNQTLQLENPQPNNAAAVLSVSVQPFHNYLFSAEVKADNVKITEAGGHFGVHLQAGASDSTAQITGSKDWTKVTLPFTTGKGETSALKISLGGRGSIATGRILIRNVQLRSIGYPK